MQFVAPEHQHRRSPRWCWVAIGKPAWEIIIAKTTQKTEIWNPFANKLNCAIFFWPPHRSIIHERLQLFDPAHADALGRKYGKRKKNVWTHMVTIWSRWPFVPIVLTSYGGHRAHLMGKSWNKCKNDNINSFWKHGYEKNTTSQFDVTGLDVWFAFTWFTGSISDMRFCCSFCWCEWQQNMTCQTANMLPLVQLFIQLVCIYMFSQHDVFISTKSAAASHVFFNNMFMSWLFFLHSSITLGNSLFLQHLFW